MIGKTSATGMSLGPCTESDYDGEPRVMKSAILATLAAALSVFATPVKAAVQQEQFTPLEEAFYNGTAACEDFFVGLINHVKLAPTQPGPFDDHGFHNSDAATEDPVRVAMLAPCRGN